MKINKTLITMDITRADAIRISLELMERVYAPGVQGIELMNRCRDIINMGVRAYRESQKTVKYDKAVEVSLAERSERRMRTLYEISQINKRFMEIFPALAGTNIRDIDSNLCHEILKASSTSPLQFNKMRAIMHSIFACGMRHGWCSSNPVDAIPHPTIREVEITPLPWDDIKKLLKTAQREEFHRCSAAVGLMLWAGVRPAELARLTWDDIDWQEKVINMRPHHTKTGGCRHVTIHPVLMEWLKKSKSRTGKICPPNWMNRWRQLREAAGIHTWQQDVLRHTFASYHLKYWHNIDKLQAEMGHRSARLLQTRYLSMKGITHRHARQFWTPGKLM